MIRRVRLRTLLLLINLVILALPLGGIWVLRLYESALIRQTEVELVAQGAVLASAFRVEHDRLLAGGYAAETGAPAAPLPEPARDLGLDLADDAVLPAPPDPTPATTPVEPISAAAGAALLPVLRDTQSATLAALRIVDTHGTIIASTGSDLGRSLAGLDEVTRALAGEPVDLMRYRDEPAREGPLRRGADLRVFVATPVAADGKVVAAILLSRTPRDLAQAIYGKRIAILAMLALLLAIGAVLALLTSRLVTRPLGLVVAQARRVAAGRAGAIAPLKGPIPREAAELSEAVARMAATLEHRADYIRNFAAHVSHEFKTPLTSAKGAVELLSDHFDSMSPEERAQFLRTVADGLDRLDRLVRRMLDLARADMARPAETASAALAPALDRLRARCPEMTLEAEVGDIAVAMPAEMLDIILGNFVDNARQHGGPSVRVTITARLEGGRVALTIGDDGPGIPPANAERIFEPFFTTRRETGGTGLGLAIIRAIATGVGGSIDLLPGPGARFRLDLPGAASP